MFLTELDWINNPMTLVLDSAEIDKSDLALPRRGPGNISFANLAKYEQEVADWCAALIQIDSRLEFKVSARGWCYVLEEYGLDKGDFSKAGKLMADCRKDGRLPIDFVLNDQSRTFDGMEDIDGDCVEDAVESILCRARMMQDEYTPRSFWDDKDHYIQALVEKIDLKSIFRPIFKDFQIPYANAKGWSDLNNRADMMRRFSEQEAEGKTCVLLYCGDHDPGGLHISDHLKSNMGDLADAVGWRPDDLIIDRFGLNFDFIEKHNLTWVENLETGTGGNLASPKHPDHTKPYVQNYIAEHGVRKVEANALITRIDAGRDLCLQAVLQYLGEADPAKYEKKVDAWRADVAAGVAKRIKS